MMVSCNRKGEIPMKRMMMTGCALALAGLFFWRAFFRWDRETPAPAV